MVKYRITKEIGVLANVHIIEVDWLVEYQIFAFRKQPDSIIKSVMEL